MKKYKLRWMGEQRGVREFLPESGEIISKLSRLCRCKTISSLSNLMSTFENCKQIALHQSRIDFWRNKSSIDYQNWNKSTLPHCGVDDLLNSYISTHFWTQNCLFFRKISKNFYLLNGGYCKFFQNFNRHNFRNLFNARKIFTSAEWTSMFRQQKEFWCCWNFLRFQVLKKFLFWEKHVKSFVISKKC